MPSETLEEVAQRIAGRYTMGGDYGTALKTNILTALNAERERCAKIVNDARVEGHADLRELVSRIRGKD